eukprot:8420084-Ditylum_brightwellii.AAC.1
MLHLNIHYFASRVHQRTAHILCPGIHAVPAATKSLAAHALNTKEATPKGIPPKNKGGAPVLLPSAPHRFLEGKGVG